MAFPSIPEFSSRLSGVLFGSRAFLALRWMVPEMILGEVASRSGITWHLCLPTWGGVDVHELACPLRRPMAHSYLARGHGLSARRCPILLLL
jgi:hypothetical protein